FLPTHARTKQQGVASQVLTLAPHCPARGYCAGTKSFLLRMTQRAAWAPAAGAAARAGVFAGFMVPESAVYDHTHNAKHNRCADDGGQHLNKHSQHMAAPFRKAGGCFTWNSQVCVYPGERAFHHICW